MPRYSSDSQTDKVYRRTVICEEYANPTYTCTQTYIDQAITGTNIIVPTFQRIDKRKHRKEWELRLWL